MEMRIAVWCDIFLMTCLNDYWTAADFTINFVLTVACFHVSCTDCTYVRCKVT